MILTQEQELLKAQKLFASLSAYVAQAVAQEQRIDEVERELFRRLLEIGHGLLAAFIAGQGSGDVGATCRGAAAASWQRLAKLHQRRYVSIFGEFSLRRFVYGTREGQKIEAVPFDQRLGLPAGEFSYLLQDWAQRFCLRGAFAEAVASLEELLGMRPSVRSLEQMNRDLASAAPAFRREQPPPPAAQEGPILVVTADGKGVPLRQPRPQTTAHRRRKGEKGKKRIAHVGAVYSIGPFRRTAAQVVDDVQRKQRAPDRPAPQHKRLRVEMTPTGEVKTGRRALFAQLATELAARDPSGRKPVVCLLDGERWLWQEQQAHFPQAVGVLDLFHVLEHLWQAAHCLYAEGSQAAARFVTERLRHVLEGNVATVIAQLRQRCSTGQLTPGRQRTLQSVIGYLANNREHMKYDAYLAAGYPIGSGVAEGACRHLVKDRMEQTGMRWTMPGAQAMLQLRAIYLNGDWDDFMNHRITQEQKALYQLAA
jgi:hypothetical protein